jgi:hypothetical protein
MDVLQLRHPSSMDRLCSIHQRRGRDHCGRYLRLIVRWERTFRLDQSHLNGTGTEVLMEMYSEMERVQCVRVGEQGIVEHLYLKVHEPGREERGGLSVR